MSKLVRLGGLRRWTRFQVINDQGQGVTPGETVYLKGNRSIFVYCHFEDNFSCGVLLRPDTLVKRMEE